MSDFLFNIFGGNTTNQALKSVVRQPLSNAENMGKTVLSGPLKPNEPLKPMNKHVDSKKSFLSNAGKAIQNTPLRQAFTPRAVNVGNLIYNDAPDKSCKDLIDEELEFTKPQYKLDNYHSDILDFLLLPEPRVLREVSPPNTPPPTTRHNSMEFNCSYQDDFFTDDFSFGRFSDDDLDLPNIY